MFILLFFDFVKLAKLSKEEEQELYNKLQKEIQKSFEKAIKEHTKFMQENYKKQKEQLNK